MIEAGVLPMLMAGLLDLDAARARGALTTKGDKSKLRQFASLFEMDFGDVDPEEIRLALEAASP